MRPLSRRRALQLGGLGVAGTVVGGTGLAWAGTARYTRTGRKRTLAGRSPMLGVPTAFPGVVAVAAGGFGGVGEQVDQAATSCQLLAQFAATLVPGGLQVLEGDGGGGEFG